MISIIHPSRSRPEKSFLTIQKWKGMAFNSDFEVIVSLDKSDEFAIKYYGAYDMFNHPIHRISIIERDNRSAIDAINNAAKKATGEILMVVSDDTEPVEHWDEKILGWNTQSDWILKTQDGIQNYIITMPVMDRAYYNRFGYIYHPDFQHLFCDTYMTCVADIIGRKITSNLLFKHNHYSVGGATMDEVNKKNDATWKQGEETFIRLMKQFTPEERNRISDQGMKNWLRNHGVR